MQFHTGPQLNHLIVIIFQTLNETKNIWTVKRSSIREAIGLNADGYAVYLGEQKVLDPPQETRNPGRTPSLGALSAVLRLNCPSRNVTQPLFYQALRRNLADEMDLGELKQLLKLASDEFHTLMELFHSVPFLSSSNGEDSFNKNNEPQSGSDDNVITALGEICEVNQEYAMGSLSTYGCKLIMA